MNDTLIQPRKPYRIQSAETWGLVRTHYLRGMSARELSERFGVSVSNIRRRAGEEGWTRRGHAEEVGPPPDRTLLLPYQPAREVAGPALSPYPPAPDPSPPAAVDPLLAALSGPPADIEEVVGLALGAAARCIAAGRFAEAERLEKLAETLSRLAHGAAGSARRGDGARSDRDLDDEPQAPPEFAKDEPFMTPGETRRSPYQMEMLRLEVEKRFERLAASFEKPGEARRCSDGDEE